ncbi:MAG: YajQ family cyclic di-GMP-binding protein [Phycisphaera sp.]|nr:YajQ family cyclic di-GMP-binding protein [Phycisphaera sp.]
MPSFDIVSRVEMQEVDNTINNTKKEVATRYDFRGSKTEIHFDRKEKKINLLTEDKMKMEAVREMLLNHAGKRKLDLKVFEFGEPQPGPQANLKREVKIKEGIPQDIAKRIVKTIKDAKMKVQASIQGEEVRVTGKQIDDLQAVITMLRGQPIEVPLQFVNMKK